MTTFGTDAVRPRGSIFSRIRLFWAGVTAVAAGTALHLPMYLSASDMNYRLEGMGVDGTMLLGMLLIVAGIAAVVVSVLPPRGSGRVDQVSVATLDDARITRAHVALILVMSLAVTIDVMKPLTIAFVLPGMATEYDLKSALNPTGNLPVALLPLIALTGTVIGSLVWGWLGDRIGRRASILIAGTIFMGTAICGTMPAYWLNFVMCFIMGVGVGGLLPITFALISETMPARHRGWLMVLIGGDVALAYLITSWLASSLTPEYTWRALWLVGLPTGLLLLLLNRWIPESPRFLIATGRGADAEAVMRRYGAKVVSGGPSELMVETGVQSTWRQLLHMPFRNTTAVVLLMGLGIGFVSFGFQLWIPSNLQSLGFSAVTSADILRNATLIGLPAAFVVAALYGFWSSRGTMILLAGVTAAALLALAVIGIDRETDRTVLYLLLTVPITTASSMLAMLAAYASEAYPTKVRSRATGLAASATKAGGVVVIALVVLSITPPTIAGTALIGAVTMALAAVAVLVAGVETRNRALERITADELQLLSASRSEDWDSKWAREDFRPAWLVETIPDDIRDAAEDGWLPKGARVLDVGCGSGEIAAWLADRGYEVVGVDFAAAAVARARAAHPERPGLRFEVGDLCADDAPLDERFDAAVDRGCLHAVPVEVASEYVGNLARMMQPEAPFLLLHHIAAEATATETEATVRGLLEPHFDVRTVTETTLVEHAEDGAPIRGLAIRLTRRPDGEGALHDTHGARTHARRLGEEHSGDDHMGRRRGQHVRNRGAGMKTDVAIIGGGPAGAAAALHLRRRGIDAVIVEKKPFPRYHVGESMTGEAGGVLRSFGLEDRLNAAGHAVKHGVNVWGKAAEWWVPVMQRKADGELAEQFTWQVRRSEFDAMLLDEACARGAELLPGRAIKPLVDDSGTVRGLTVGEAGGGELDVEAEMVLDCSGQSTFMASQRMTGPKYVGAYDKQIAIFSQVAGFERAGGEDGRKSMPGNTQIFYKGKYHWAWAIPLDDDVVSVGVVIPAQYFVQKGESKEQFLRRELQELHPELARRLPEVEFVEDMHAVPNYSFQVRSFAGPGFICVGDSHRFVDPIFSFGVHVAVHEAELATDTTLRWLEGEGRDGDELMHEHMVACERRIDVFEDLIDCFWQDPLAFAFFAHARYKESLIDAFAGRGTAEEPLPIVKAVRKVLKRTRTYDGDGLYSVPFGSRFQPDQAAHWEQAPQPVATTESWMHEA